MPFRTLREGDFFGEENLQAFSNLDYTVICLQDNSEIAFLEKNSFEQSVESYERIVQRAKMQVKYVTS
jgi:CRP-like cAMP-binding protein